MSFEDFDFDFGHYILDEEHQPVKVGLMRWAMWMEHEQRTKGIVGSTETKLYLVSTVFLGLDHGWGRGPPVLFETMVFDRDLTVVEWWGGRLASIHKSIDEDGMFYRYSTWDDALTGHKTLVRRIRRAEAEAKEMMHDRPRQV